MSLIKNKGPFCFPPLRFATVEEGLYRSAYPTLRNLRYLRRLRLRTILAMVPKDPTADLSEFCKAEGIQLLHQPGRQENGRTSRPLSVSFIASIISIIIDPGQLPCLLFCLDGIQFTGVVIMCLRKLQHWHINAIFSEHLRFSAHFNAIFDPHTRISTEIEKFVILDFGIDGQQHQREWVGVDDEVHDTAECTMAESSMLSSLPPRLFSLPPKLRILHSEQHDSVPASCESAPWWSARRGAAPCPAATRSG